MPAAWRAPARGRTRAECLCGSIPLHGGSGGLPHHGRVSLLPSTHTPEVIGQLAGFAPDAFCLTDDARCDIGLPKVYYPEESRPPSPGPLGPCPEIPVTQLAAIVFTSGSTGTPLPYKKTWGRLARCVRDGAPRLGLAGRQIAR
jgi:hypothetical protein